MVDMSEVCAYFLDDSLPSTPLAEVYFRGGSRLNLGGDDARGFIQMLQMKFDLTMQGQNKP